MINLLPPIEKEKRIQERNLKLVWVLGILVTASILSFSLILFSIKFYIADQIRTQQALVDMERGKNVKVKVLQDKIKSVNTTLLELNNFYQKQFSGTMLLDRISSLLLPNMYLDSFNYTEENGRIVLSCWAPSVEVIHQFREKMRSQRDFKDINFVLPDWLQSQNINFKVSFYFENEL